MRYDGGVKIAQKYTGWKAAKQMICLIKEMEVETEAVVLRNDYGLTMVMPGLQNLLVA